MDDREHAMEIADEETLVSADFGDRLVATSAKEIELDGSHDGCLRELYPYQPLCDP